jgi:hypothetical protein
MSFCISADKDYVSMVTSLLLLHKVFDLFPWRLREDKSNVRNQRLIAAVRYEAAYRSPLHRIVCLKYFVNLWRECLLKM